ncbi:MAG: transcriptional repressor [Ilumatobacteraceae bacterium]
MEAAAPSRGGTLDSIRVGEIHRRVKIALGEIGFRHTATCRVIVEVLAAATAPMMIAAMIEACPNLPPSSAYRTVRNLHGAGALVEVPHVGAARYELSTQVGAVRRHHALCRSCGDVMVAPSTAGVDAAFALVASALRDAEMLAEWQQVTLVGTCCHCRT